MTDRMPSPNSPGKTSEPHKHYQIPRSWKIASVIGTLMVLLALLGVGLTTTSRANAPIYWMSLVPVYGLMCVGIAIARARHDGRPMRPAIVRQVLHWSGIAIALGLDFVVRDTGEESATAAGLNALLLLALGCYLAGVHLEWVFGLVGVMLTITLLVVAKAEQYLWLVFVAGGVIIAAIFVVQSMLARLFAKRSAGH